MVHQKILTISVLLCTLALTACGQEESNEINIEETNKLNPFIKMDLTDQKINCSKLLTVDVFSKYNYKTTTGYKFEQCSAEIESAQQKKIIKNERAQKILTLQLEQKRSDRCRELPKYLIGNYFGRDREQLEKDSLLCNSELIESTNKRGIYELIGRAIKIRGYIFDSYGMTISRVIESNRYGFISYYLEIDQGDENISLYYNTYEEANKAQDDIANIFRDY
jgi:hypothetical protein